MYAMSSSTVCHTDHSVLTPIFVAQGVFDKKEQLLGKHIYDNTQDKAVAVAAAKAQLDDAKERTLRLEFMVC